MGLLGTDEWYAGKVVINLTKSIGPKLHIKSIDSHGTQWTHHDSRIVKEDIQPFFASVDTFVRYTVKGE